MAISLKKGERISLEKLEPQLNRIFLGLGWDVNEAESNHDFDLDASVLALSKQKKLLVPNKDFVNYENLTHPSKAIRHQGDNLTGAGEGDDEIIDVVLQGVPENIHYLRFLVNIYKALERSQHFGQVKNAFIRLVNQDTKEELARYSLSDNYSGRTVVTFADIYREGNEWKILAIGEGSNEKGLREIRKLYT